MTSVLRLTYPLASPRLVLRPLGRRDIAAVVAYRSQPEICRYVPFEPMDADAVARRLDGAWSRTEIDGEGQALVVGIEERASGALVGDLTLIWVSQRDRLAEIGYVLNPVYGHRGYATEAAHRLLHLVFDDFCFHRAIARIVADNRASAQVARRLGLRQEAHLVQHEWFKGAWIDELVFAVLADEWFAGHRSAGPMPDAASCPTLRPMLRVQPSVLPGEPPATS